jgi:glycosyltransferase involved in cell wall biosynthesis
MRILVSNPSKQYTPYLIQALLQSGHQVWFATSYWYRSNHWILRTLSVLNQRLATELQKKQDKSIDEAMVLTNPWGTLYKFLGRFIIRDVERWSYYEDRIHDRWAKGLLKKYQPEIVIGYEKSCRDTFKLARQHGIKTILDLAQVHTAFIQQLRQTTSFFSSITGTEKLFQTIHRLKQEEYGCSDQVICLSDFAAQTMTQAGFPKEKLGVANLGFDPKRFQPKSSYQQSVKLQLIYVGIVTRRKGLHLLIELMQTMQDLPIHLTVVGPWGDASDILNAKSNYPNITYIPYLHHEALAAQLRQSDVFILPSYLDSWAAVVLEAMACGLPVITTTHTGASEVVGDDAGVVLEAGDANGLQNAVMGYLNNPSLIEQHGRCAAAKVQQYHWGRYFEEVQWVVDNTLVN